ncbi:hypothetical protein ACFL04_02525 [Patescibacteria group bacterium]
MKISPKKIEAEEKKVENKATRRQRKKRPIMKVSGRQVFQLKNIIKKRAKSR